MLDDLQVDLLCRQLSITESGRQLVRRIRSSDPARRVGGGRSNVCVRYPSRKMGFVVQAESHTVELSLVYELEHDPEVLEYYDQPEHLTLRYASKNGKNLGVSHTPDFLVICRDRIEFVECKTEEDLVALSEKMPNRYRKEEDGRWICPPGEGAASEFGLSYRVWSSSGIDWTFQENIRFIEDYLRDECLDPSSALSRKVRLWLDRKKAATLSDLLAGDHGAKADEIFRMIATEQLYFDFHSCRLSEPDRAWVSLDRETGQAYSLLMEGERETDFPVAVTLLPGETVLWDAVAWELVNVGPTSIALSSAEEKIVSLPVSSFEKLVESGAIIPSRPVFDKEKSFASKVLEETGKESLEVANRRCELLKESRGSSSDLAGGKTPSERTLRRWRASFRAMEQRLGNGYLGLVPRTTKRGNRTSRMNETVERLMAEAISEIYETKKQVRIRTAYEQFRLNCEREHLPAPSYETFRCSVRKRPKEEQARKREGKRVAYAHSIFHWRLERTTPRHGSRPFEIVHVDHTELDIELVGTGDGRTLGRPWLTLMIDAYSRSILAFYLTFDPPSSQSCMMIVRDCVRRWQRLPAVFVVDNGKEFESVYFESLLASYECIKKSRPPAQARFGSVCERLFGTTNTEMIYALAGNTQITKKVRIMTKSFDPKRQALWTLPDLHSILEEFFFGVYNETPHPALNESPKHVLDEGLARTGIRSHRLVPYSEDFKMRTLPSTPKGTATVNPNTGMQIHNIRYWHDGFRNPELSGKSVPVRYDPENCGIAYAFLSGRWVQCISQQYETMKGRSLREIALASRELTAKNKEFSKRKKIKAKDLALFLEGAHRHEEILDRRKKDSEAGMTGTSNIRAIPRKQFEGETDRTEDGAKSGQEPSPARSESVLPFPRKNLPVLEDF